MDYKDMMGYAYIAFPYLLVTLGFAVGMFVGCVAF